VVVDEQLFGVFHRHAAVVEVGEHGLKGDALLGFPFGERVVG